MPTPGNSPRPYNRLSPTQWDSVCSLYATGGNTLAELSHRYSVSVGAIYSNAKARGIARVGKSFSPAALASVASAVIAGAPNPIAPPKANRAATTAATAEERARATNDEAYNDTQAIQTLLRLSVAALQVPTTPADAVAVVRACDLAIAALSKCNKIRREVLRMDAENGDIDRVLPDLPISVMTDGEVEQMRAEQEAQDGLTPGELEARIDAAAADKEAELDEDDIIEETD